MSSGASPFHSSAPSMVPPSVAPLSSPLPPWNVQSQTLSLMLLHGLLDLLCSVSLQHQAAWPLLSPPDGHSSGRWSAPLGRPFRPHRMCGGGEGEAGLQGLMDDLSSFPTGHRAGGPPSLYAQHVKHRHKLRLVWLPQPPKSGQQSFSYSGRREKPG